MFSQGPRFSGSLHGPYVVRFFVQASLEQHCVLLRSQFLCVPPPSLCAFAFLSCPLWDSFSFVRVPYSLGPSSSLVCFCVTLLAALGKLFVLLGTRLLWVPPNPLSAFAFLPWLFWDSFCFLRVPASLDPSHLLCGLLFCPGFPGTAFVLLGSWLLWVHPPYCLLLGFSVPATRGQSFPGHVLSGSFQQVPGFSVSFTPLCAIVLCCPGFSGTVFCGSWLIWIPSPLFSICIVGVIPMHGLTAWHLYQPLNASQELLLLLLPGSHGTL